MRIMVLIILLVAGWALPGCSTNPATGKTQFNLMSPASEISLGISASPQFLESYGGEIPSATITQYVAALGQRLAAASERTDLPWSFSVVDSKTINAFALPGGKVFISRGLLAKLENEAQLAGVLGHEIGHVTAQHVGQQMSRGMVVQGLAIGLGIAGSKSNEQWLQTLGVGVQVGGTVYLLKYGRGQEIEADILGVRYMSRLGYDPQAQLQVMRILQQAAGNRPASLEFLSTHPLPQTRIKRLEEHLQEHYAHGKDSATYRTNAGIFRDTVRANLDKLPPPKHGQKATDKN